MYTVFAYENKKPYPKEEKGANFIWVESKELGEGIVHEKCSRFNTWRLHVGLGMSSIQNPAEKQPITVDNTGLEGPVT